jgi:hypothetical protein
MTRALLRRQQWVVIVEFMVIGIGLTGVIRRD